VASYVVVIGGREGAGGGTGTLVDVQKKMPDMAKHSESSMSDEGVVAVAHAENTFVPQSTELVL
jgi:hypothetical protein